MLRRCSVPTKHVRHVATTPLQGHLQLLSKVDTFAAVPRVWAASTAIAERGMVGDHWDHPQAWGCDQLGTVKSGKLTPKILVAIITLKVYLYTTI